MNEFFKEVKEDKILLRGSIFSGTLILISLVCIVIYYNSLPPLIPIFNQMPWGEERIAKNIFIFLVPLIAFLVFVANLIFATYVYKKIPLISRLFSMTSLLASILTLLFIIRTIHTIL